MKISSLAAAVVGTLLMAGSGFAQTAPSCGNFAAIGEATSRHYVDLGRPGVSPGDQRIASGPVWDNDGNRLGDWNVLATYVPIAPDQTVNVQAPQTVGSLASGVEVQGVQSVGVQQSGVQGAGVGVQPAPSVGVQQSGVQGAGVQGAGDRMIGTSRVRFANGDLVFHTDRQIADVGDETQSGVGSPVVNPVIGGTGEFANVTGTMKITPRQDGRQRLDFNLSCN